MKRGGESSPRDLQWSWRLACILAGIALSSLLFAGQSSGPDESVRKVHLHQKTFDLHLSPPVQAALSTRSIFVLFASGDGGWFGAAVEMFKEIARLGYPTAGFSSRSYMKELSDPIRP